jgi:hypothetical protein
MLVATVAPEFHRQKRTEGPSIRRRGLKRLHRTRTKSKAVAIIQQSSSDSLPVADPIDDFGSAIS